MEVRPGYKRTEAGVIPKDWEVDRLGGVAEVVMGQSPAGMSYNQNGVGIPLINGPTEFTDKYPIKKQWTTQPTKICKTGDLLLCVRGSSTGRMNISNDEYCIGRGVAAIRAKPGADTAFITFQVDSAIQQLLALSAGSTFPNVDGKSIRSIPVPLPPLSEQRAIAAALGDVDALITALERLIAKKRAIKQGAMQQLLTGKTRLPGFEKIPAKYKQTKIGVIPEDWMVKTSDEICLKIQDGTHFSPSLGGNDHLYVTSKNIGFGVLDISDAERIDASQHKAIYSRCDVKKGDLLLTKDGANTGNAALNYLEEEISLLSSVAFLRFDSRQHIAGYYLQQILSPNGQRRIKELMAGNAITRLTLEKIRELCFPVPPIPEQRAIASVLSDMDAEITALEAKRDKTSALKQGMMQTLLTGEIRLI